MTVQHMKLREAFLEARTRGWQQVVNDGKSRRPMDWVTNEAVNQLDDTVSVEDRGAEMVVSLTNPGNGEVIERWTFAAPLPIR